MRYQYTPIRIAKKKIVTVAIVGEDTEKLHHLYFADGSIKLYSHSEKQILSFLKS